MFIAISVYLKPLKDIDLVRMNHWSYLKKYIELGKVMISGRQDPPIGGIIISSEISRDEFDFILSQDPFVTSGLVRYKIIKFHPSDVAKVSF